MGRCLSPEAGKEVWLRPTPPRSAPLCAAPRPGRTSSWPSSVQACSLKCVMLMAVMTCPFLLESHAQWGKMISL